MSAALGNPVQLADQSAVLWRVPTLREIYDTPPPERVPLSFIYDPYVKSASIVNEAVATSAHDLFVFNDLMTTLELSTTRIFAPGSPENDEDDTGPINLGQQGARAINWALPLGSLVQGIQPQKVMAAEVLYVFAQQYMSMLRFAPNSKAIKNGSYLSQQIEFFAIQTVPVFQKVLVRMLDWLRGAAIRAGSGAELHIKIVDLFNLFAQTKEVQNVNKRLEAERLIAANERTKKEQLQERLDLVMQQYGAAFDNLSGRNLSVEDALRIRQEEQRAREYAASNAFFSNGSFMKTMLLMRAGPIAKQAADIETKDVRSSPPLPANISAWFSNGSTIRAFQKLRSQSVEIPPTSAPNSKVEPSPIRSNIGAWFATSSMIQAARNLRSETVEVSTPNAEKKDTPSASVRTNMSAWFASASMIKTAQTLRAQSTKPAAPASDEIAPPSKPRPVENGRWFASADTIQIMRKLKESASVSKVVAASRIGEPSDLPDKSPTSKSSRPSSNDFLPASDFVSSMVNLRKSVVRPTQSSEASSREDAPASLSPAAEIVKSPSATTPWRGFFSPPSLVTTMQQLRNANSGYAETISAASEREKERDVQIREERQRIADLSEALTREQARVNSTTRDATRSFIPLADQTVSMTNMLRKSRTPVSPVSSSPTGATSAVRLTPPRYTPPPPLVPRDASTPSTLPSISPSVLFGGAGAFGVNRF